MKYRDRKLPRTNAPIRIIECARAPDEQLVSAASAKVPMLSLVHFPKHETWEVIVERLEDLSKRARTEDFRSITYIIEHGDGSMRVASLFGDGSSRLRMIGSLTSQGFNLARDEYE